MPGREHAFQNSCIAKIPNRLAEHANHSPDSDAVYRATDRLTSHARPSSHKNPPTDSAISSTIHGTTECKYECPVRRNTALAADPYAR